MRITGHHVDQASSEESLSGLPDHSAKATKKRLCSYLYQTTLSNELGQAMGLTPELHIALRMAQDGCDASHGKLENERLDAGRRLEWKLQEEILPRVRQGKQFPFVQSRQELGLEAHVTSRQDFQLQSPPPTR